MEKRGLLFMIINKIEKLIKEEGIKIKKIGSFNTSDPTLTFVSVIARSYNGKDLF